MYKKGDIIEVIISASFVKEGTKGVIISFDKSTHKYHIDWGDGWCGYLYKECIKKLDEPERFIKLGMVIKPLNNKRFKGVLEFKHRGKTKFIEVEDTCEYNVCKKLVSYFKHDPLKHCKE